ncbi:hypothetical protein Naga_101468g1, partial [Nannochloropsis gaditana]
MPYLSDVPMTTLLWVTFLSTAHTLGIRRPTHNTDNMRVLFVSACLVVLGIAYAPTAVAQECPTLTLTGKARPGFKRGVLAGKGHARVTVTLRSKEVVDDLNFKLLLPTGLSLVRTSSRPKARIHPEVVENPDGSTAVFWLGFDFAKAKGNKRVFKAKAKVDACAPETLTVTGLAYLVNATDLTTYCATPLASPAVLNVRYSKAKKVATCAPTPAPTVNPAQPFVLFGDGQRCLEASRLAPFDDRRLLSSSNGREYAHSIHREHRHLQSIATPSDCFTYCSLNGGESVPFFFNWNTVTSQCFCCGNVCTLIVDPAFSAYEVTMDATSAPTAVSTATPTPAPTASPTLTPTASPTAVPTATPTAAPTASPTAAPTKSPTAAPTTSPTAAPTASPTAAPTASPTAAPTTSPTAAPTASPTAAPTASPTTAPTASPTAAPTASPTTAPTASPTAAPTASPTAAPTASPTAAPTASPTAAPTASPTAAPTASPTAAPTTSPTAAPTTSPT